MCGTERVTFTSRYVSVLRVSGSPPVEAFRIGPNLYRLRAD